MTDRKEQAEDVIGVLFVGDIVAEPGLKALARELPQLVEEYRPTFVVVNGENTYGGKGLRPSDADTIFSAGADVITSGNHIWERWQSKKTLSERQNVLRPENYPPGAVGTGRCVVEKAEVGLEVWNLQGLTFMPDIDCPFRAADRLFSERKSTWPIVVDFHGEATAEKIAFARYVDGRVSAVVGTHTHVPTSDAQILPRGTGYVTDLGMTGSYSSVIGMEIEPAINRFLFKTPFKYEPADGDLRLAGAYIEIGTDENRCRSIEQVIAPPFLRAAPGR